MSQKVLLIEDALEYQKIVSASLGEKFEVTCAGCAEDALAELSRHTFDILLIDVGLPGRDGLSLCQELRADPRLVNTPILMVTGRGETLDVVQGFEAGADDYIQKPFRPEELRARVGARLKRAKAQRGSNASGGAPSDRFECGDLRFSVGRQRVSIVMDGVEKAFDLTPNEFKILYFLARSEGKTLSRAEILKEVWGQHLHVVERTVDKHVCALRRKLGDAGCFVASVAGEGYRFDVKALELPAKRTPRAL
jgi:DNA-binding response OmpR family regulator